VSAEVPKLQHRFSLGDPAIAGDRPPAEVIVVLADPAAFLPPQSSSRPAVSTLNDHSMAFEAVGRFEYV
jgi:hypothetical protein